MKTIMLVLAVALMTSGIRCLSAAEKNDLADQIAAQNKKLTADLRSGAQKEGSFVSSNGSGVSHLIDAHNGNVIERDYNTNSCSVSSSGSTVEGVTNQVVTVKGDNKLLETLEWNGKTVTIKDANGKLIEKKTF